jgi:hypothetical protein
MLNEPRVYRHAPIQIVLTIVLFAMLAAGVSLAVNQDTIFIVLPFGFFLLLLALFSIYSLTVRTAISDSEISVQSLLGSKSLGWSEINRVSGRGNGIKLHNFDDDVTVSPSPQLPGYEEIVDWIGTKRPDLFTPQENEEMNRNLFIVLLSVMAIILIIGIASFSIIQADQWYLSIFFVFVGTAISIILLSAPRSITLEGRSLLLKYIFHEKALLADEIESIQLASQRTRNGKTYHIRINLAGGKGGLRIAGMRPSLPIVYLTLKNWHNKMKLSSN